MACNGDIGTSVAGERHRILGADYGFLSRHPDYQHLVVFIQTGDHHWLDFYMEPESKIDLFARGVEAAIQFLMKFDWDDYRDIRLRLLET